MITRLLLFFLLYSTGLWAQERVAPLDHNPSKGNSCGLQKQLYKTTAIGLPFFEDFTDYSPIPNSARWVDADVYVNNTMSADVISRGMATFDALNENSGPYDSSNFNTLRKADSLTSQSIDLSTYTVADSVYLSFFYQPQGLGFAPEVQDSLMLFLKRINGSWDKAWAVAGSAVQPFIQVMISVRDTAYFGNDFQFRFINKASINLNDDVWNVDYVRMDRGRTINDTAIQDVATTIQPSFLLNDYTVMPYEQFVANTAAELQTEHSFTVRNNTANTANVNYNYTAKEAISNTSLATGNTSSAAIPAYSSQSFSFPMYNTSFPDPGGRVVFEQEYAISSAGPVLVNDTIRKQQVFDEYLAYDDGTAEKSYFLNQFATLPANLAIEYHLNQQDTIFGVAIYFGRQVPLAFGKFFSVMVYQNIAINGGSNQLIYQQDLLFPGYADTVNKFWNYKFDIPVYMQPGAFFLGTQQPSASGSDSLYFGLDVNRVGGNHLYFNVQDFWESSTVGGAIMMRPLTSNNFTPSSIVGTKRDNRLAINIYPNPATDVVQLSFAEQNGTYLYHITDMQGRVVKTAALAQDNKIDISELATGAYLLSLSTDGRQLGTQKLMKL